MRTVLAILAGIVVAVGLVMGIEAVGHRAYPFPANVDVSNRGQVRELMTSLPSGALLFVIAAWAIATLVGGYVAAAIARTRPLLFAGIVGTLILVGAIANLMMFPHPTWMAVSGVVGIVVSTWAAAKLAAPRERAGASGP